MTAPAPTILLVDDEPLVQRLYARAVGSMGFTPRFACDSAEALEAVEREPPALLMTDLNLGADSGLDLARTLVARTMKRFPVMLCSGDDTVPIFVAGAEAGIDDFLVKGMSFAVLIERLRFWVDGPFAGLPAHMRAQALDTLQRVAPIGPPVARMRAPATLLFDRARQTMADLLAHVRGGFGFSEIDRIRFLGVLDRVLLMLSRTNALAHFRRPDIMLTVIESLELPWRARLVHEELTRLDALVEDATFRHAGQTLGLQA